MMKSINLQIQEVPWNPNYTKAQHNKTLTTNNKEKILRAIRKKWSVIEWGTKEKIDLKLTSTSVPFTPSTLHLAQMGFPTHFYMPWLSDVRNWFMLTNSHSGVQFRMSPCNEESIIHLQKCLQIHYFCSILHLYG